MFLLPKGSKVCWHPKWGPAWSFSAIFPWQLSNLVKLLSSNTTWIDNFCAFWLAQTSKNTCIWVLVWVPKCTSVQGEAETDGLMNSSALLLEWKLVWQKNRFVKLTKRNNALWETTQPFVPIYNHKRGTLYKQIHCYNSSGFSNFSSHNFFSFYSSSSLQDVFQDNKSFLNHDSQNWTVYSYWGHSTANWNFPIL